MVKLYEASVIGLCYISKAIESLLLKTVLPKILLIEVPEAARLHDSKFGAGLDISKKLLKSKIWA